MHGSSGSHEASGGCLSRFFPFFILCMPWSLLPALAKPAAPHPHISQMSQHLCASPPWGARVCTQRIAPESETGSRLQGLRGRHVGPDSALVEEVDFLTLTRLCLVQSSWMEASGPGEQQEWAEPVGGTDIWQRPGSQAWSL